MRSGLFCGLLVTALLVRGLGIAQAASVQIDAMRHDIQQITMSNFDGVVSKFRDDAVSSLWFFKGDSDADAGFLDKYNLVASELNGMAKILAISCTDWPVFCDEQGVKETPTVMIYPTNPLPAFRYGGKLEPEDLLASILQQIPDLAANITNENVDTFVSADPLRPKLLLFSSKKTPPTMWKALSSERIFKRVVKFGFVSGDETDVVQKFKVQSFPSVLMMRLGPQAEIKESYSGEFSYSALKDWISEYVELVNLHSRTGIWWSQGPPA